VRKFIAFTAVLLAPCLSPTPAAETPDLARVDRAIKKEPAYVAKDPL
jgi:hypothetical protein